MLNRLFREMVDYYGGDPKRIQHFVKVHAFAKQIAAAEHVDAKTKEILEAAAYVHDIGIKPAQQKYGSCAGNLQELEGPPVARQMLARLEFEKALIDRVCYLVGHHHTYTDIDGIDYQILAEADFLVNLYEDSLNKAAALAAYEKIFRTESGKWLCSVMFGIS